MTRTPDALIEPELLVWARRAAGFQVEEAARRLSVSDDRLRAWEAGEARPTIAQLRKAATVYKRPLAIFYLPEPPLDYQPLRDYRRVPDAEVGRLSPELLGSIRRARAVREATLELRELADEAIGPPPRLEDGSHDPERIGNLARSLLGVTLEQQQSWADPGLALNAWIDAVSNSNVLVLQAQSISVQEMRGFSIWSDLLPLVVLNGGDFPRGRIFTLMHEFAHILLHADGVCDALPRREIRRPTDKIEILCNQVAAATLMPASEFREEASLHRAEPEGRWSDDAIQAVSEAFSVSQEATVRRLYSLGLTDWDFLQEKQAEYRAAFEVYREDLQRQRQAEKKSGGPSYYRMKVRDLGRDFIEAALDAYSRRAITGSDLSEFLEIKLNQVPKLEAELATTGRGRD
jgi:Zn-dependent peptidase ImmA (M78 family)/transcriptional regulator with XRE-family HTH domain